MSTDPAYWEKKLSDLLLRLRMVPPPKSSWQELLSMQVTGRADEYFEVYLLAVDRNGLATNAEIAARRFLERSDYQSTAKFYSQALLFEAEAARLFTAAEDINLGSLDRAYQAVRIVYDSSKYSSQILAAVTCPTTPSPEFCRDAVDAVFMATDFAVDYSASGGREATKNLLRDLIVSKFMERSGADDFLKKSVGQSGLYEELSKASGDRDFRVAVMRAAAETGVTIPEEALSASLETLREAASRFRQ